MVDGIQGSGEIPQKLKGNRWQANPLQTQPDKMCVIRFGQMDTDGDKRVSKEELDKFLAKDRDFSGELSKRFSKFGEYDATKDKALNPKEFTQLYFDTHKKAAEYEVKTTDFVGAPYDKDFIKWQKEGAKKSHDAPANALLTPDKKGITLFDKIYNAEMEKPVKP